MMMPSMEKTSSNGKKKKRSRPSTRTHNNNNNVDGRHGPRKSRRNNINLQERDGDEAIRDQIETVVVAPSNPFSAAVTTNGRCVVVSERYEKIGRVGQGTYGVVYKARDKHTRLLVALKRCLPHHQATDGFPITTLREIQSLRVCARHPNVVHLDTIATSRSGVFLVFEYCDHDLADLIDRHYRRHRSAPFSIAQTKRLVWQLLSALEFVHRHHLMHRDIKMSNLLYTRSGMLKLADFGLSRYYYNDNHSDDENDGTPLQRLTQNVASLWYRPPELLLGATHYSHAIDLYASGCIMAEFLQGFPLMMGKDEMDQINKLIQCLGVPTRLEWPALPDMPLIRDGTVRLTSSSSGSSLVRPSQGQQQQQQPSLLDAFAFLSTAGLTLLTSLLHYNPRTRWTASQALGAAFFHEDPMPTPVQQMPQFRN